MFEIALNVEEVAELLRISRHTVYRLAQRGDLPGRKIGRIWRFSRRGVEQYLSGNLWGDESDSTEPAHVQRQDTAQDRGNAGNDSETGH